MTTATHQAPQKIHMPGFSNGHKSLVKVWLAALPRSDTKAITSSLTAGPMTGFNSPPIPEGQNGHVSQENV